MTILWKIAISDLPSYRLLPRKRCIFLSLVSRFYQSIFTLNTSEGEMRMLKIWDRSRNIELSRLLFIGTNESLFASNRRAFLVNIVGCK